jgi:hypothetical protein
LAPAGVLPTSYHGSAASPVRVFAGDFQSIVSLEATIPQHRTLQEYDHVISGSRTTDGLIPAVF